jgi:uncharacterized FAD-dependent dehydrogenase
MKKIVLLIAVVAATCLANAETKDTDKKWLEAVQKMVAEGKKDVSTPNQARVDLVKEWAKKQGYSVDVSKTQVGFRIELTKPVAKK